ncbi:MULTISPECIES: hypothetical protein [Brevundimonas]|uniref:hypothetical protein n=1 Tax=Brevundimonas TaxID=41275 RepID=UPI0018F3DE18|nr:hypothetical protein [Brevundimonas sp. LPMIX5]
MQSMGVLAVPTDLEIQGGMEVPGVFMDFPQADGMGDDGQRRPAPFSLNGRIN